MSIARSIEVLNERKAAVLHDPERDSEGTVLELDDWRPVLVGLDLDIHEVEMVASACARHALDAVNSGRISLLLSVRAIAFDLFIAGVYYERERSRAAASGGADHA